MRARSAWAARSSARSGNDMSRIGNLPITVPSGVTVDVASDNLVTVKGPKGELKMPIAKTLSVKQEDGTLTVSRPDNDRINRSQHGLARTMINNMVVGVTTGHAKALEVIGVGYRASQEGRGLLLNMGYSHPVRMAAIDGITFEVIAD